MPRFLHWLQPEDWKRGCALTILYAYAYNLVVYPLLYWIIMTANYLFGWALPGPILVPWEALATGTLNLAVIGGIQAWKDSKA